MGCASAKAGSRDEAFGHEPLPETLVPLVHRQIVWDQGEAMPACRIEVQFGSTAGRAPGGVEIETVSRVHQFVVAGRSQEQRRRIGRHRSGAPDGVDRRHETGAALGVVVRRRVGRDGAAGRKAHDAQSIGIDVPAARLPPDRSQRLQTIGDGRGAHPVHVCAPRGRISGQAEIGLVVVGRGSDPILEHERRDPAGVQPAGDLSPFLVDHQALEPAARTDDDPDAVGARRFRHEHRQRRPADIANQATLLP
jgi:hypothetical protein